MLANATVTVIVDASTFARLLRERDEARDEGDALARALADHLAGRPVDLTAALRRYGERGGPAFALAPR